MATFVGHQTVHQAKYDPDEGFYVMWDYILGLKSRHKNIKVVCKLVVGMLVSY